MSSDVNYFGQLNFRGNTRHFGIKTDDRRRHMYVLGKTGMGKSAMLQNMAIQDIRNGNGVGVIDPHGEFAEALLDYVPDERINDVVYFNPSDYEYAMGFNVLENVDFDKRHLIASGLMGVFKKLWPDVWSARMEYILNNAILALLEYPEATLLGVNRMFSNPDFRKKVVAQVTDPVVKTFWVDEYAKYTQRLEAEATAAIQNKVGQFTSAPLIRNIIGQVNSTINLRTLMDEGKIFIANLSIGKIGEDNSRLLGSMLMTKLYLAAMSRVDVPEAQRRDFFMFIDEFQNFQSKAFADVLSQARKYRLSLTLAHQYITQMDEEVSDAVFGNVGTILTFRVGAQDAEFLEPEFDPEFTVEDFVNLGKYRIVLKLMIDGLASRGFSAQTIAPIEAPEISYRDEIIAHSRLAYTKPRKDVEEYIVRWHEEIMTGSVSPEDGRSGAGERSDRGAAGELYEATCATCGKLTMVPFKPDGKRPVYCKKCRKQKEENSGGATQRKNQSKFDGPGVNARTPKDGTSISSNEAIERFSASRIDKASASVLEQDDFDDDGGDGDISLAGQEERTKKSVDLPKLRELLREFVEGDDDPNAPNEEPDSSENKPLDSDETPDEIENANLS